MRSPVEASPLPLKVDTIDLQNGNHPLEVRHLSLDRTAVRKLPGDAPLLTIGLTNGFVESAETFEPVAAALIGVGAAHGIAVDTFGVNAPRSYSQEQHSDDAMTAYKEIINRSENESTLVGVGHSRGCITLTNVHEQLPDIAFSLNIAPPGCDPLGAAGKGLVSAIMAGRMLRESQHTAVHLLKDIPKLHYGKMVLRSLGANAIEHFFQSGLQSVGATIDEVYEIVQSERYRYMERLVDLHNATGATGVVICGGDALCLPRQSANNLRAAGYTGTINNFTKTSHIDPLSRPKQYAPKVFNVLSSAVMTPVSA